MILTGMTGRRRHTGLPIPARCFCLQHYKIVLFEVQLLIRHDKDFGSAFALQRFKTLPFFVLEKSRDGRMGAHDDPLLFGSLPDFSDLAKDLIGDRGRRLGIASAITIPAWLGKRAQKIFPHALA